MSISLESFILKTLGRGHVTKNPVHDKPDKRLIIESPMIIIIQKTKYINLLTQIHSMDANTILLVVGLIAGLGIGIPVMVQFVAGVSRKMSTNDLAHQQYAGIVSKNLTLNSISATEEASKISQQG